MSDNKPSECLFVRCILPHCKRIGPLWLKNVTNLRQKYRDSSFSNTGKSHEPKQLNEEINIVVNLLRKLYREIQPQYIMNLIRFWLNFPDISDDNSCILTKGDCRGRMKRIDGGKGADKVWRLDTLIGIMYHGLPLTSADSNMIYHTCHHDLCIRPQHLRFKAASVSLVLVLKALEQTGYSIKYDKAEEDRFDEFVDVAGPFNILELEHLRHELVQVTQMNSYKLACSSDDIFILDQNPSLKRYYLKNTPLNSPVEIVPKTNGKELKKRLLTRLSENLRSKTTTSNNESKISGICEKFEDSSPVECSHLKRKSSQSLELDLYFEAKNPKSFQIKSDILKTDENDEKELIEIMEKRNSSIRKFHIDVMNNWYPHMTDSPFKTNLDGFAKISTRSETESTLELMDKKRSSQISQYCLSQLKRNSEDDSKLDEYRASEFLDMFHSMRHHTYTDSSLKMTPNIFSPVSEIEES